MPAHLSLTPKRLAFAMCVVAQGGAAGTLVRYLFVHSQATGFTGWTAYAPPPLPPWTHEIPWTLLVVNTLGAYVATWLLRRPLRQHDPNDPWRLVLVTGFLGGLTSYSGLFVDLAVIWHRSAVGALLVGTGALVAGVGAASLGLVGWRHR